VRIFHDGHAPFKTQWREHRRRTPMRWSPRRPFWFLVATNLLLTACSTVGTFSGPESGLGNPPPLMFAHRVATPDVEVYWNCTRPEPGLVELDGVVHNIGGRDVRFVELNLVGVDARGHSVSQTTTSLSDVVLTINQTSPFHLRLRTAGTEMRFDLYYQYRSGVGSGFSGFQDGTHHFYARDVCPGT